MSTIKTVEELEALYGFPGETSLVKEVDYITEHYRQLIEVSPFMTLATIGSGGLDCSPRGDSPGFVRVVDEKKLVFPDRRGNNRADSLKNIIQDARVAMLFLIPGAGTTLRVNGSAEISVDTQLLESFAVKGALPRSAIVVHVETVFFQCARAIVRSQLWNSETFLDPKQLPGPGQILQQLSDSRIDGEQYDQEWPERAKKTMW